MSVELFGPDITLAKAREVTRRVDALSPMRGFEAFGCSDKGEDPTVRPLRAVRAGERLEDWPAGEVVEGVAAVTISTYGDQPGGAYIYVCGPDRDACEKRWLRARDCWMAIHAALWGAALVPETRKDHADAR